jgi:hypothetical protein
MSLEATGAPWPKLEELAAMSDAGLPDASDLDDPELRQLRSALDDMLDQVKGEIRAGRSTVVWHAFTWAENDLVVGFDDDAGTLIGRGSYAGVGDEYAVEPQFRTLTAAHVGGWPSALLIGEKTADPDLSALELASLQDAVAHGRSDLNAADIGNEPWTFLEGLRAYDQWIEHFGDEGKKRDMGDAYCYGVYRTARKAAGAFLREIAPRHSGISVKLTDAAAHFDAESQILYDAEQLLYWESPEGPDAQRNREVVDVLTHARAEYAAGIESIESALATADL